jgi:hypothetical protein
VDRPVQLIQKFNRRTARHRSFYGALGIFYLRSESLQGFGIF